MRKLFLLRGLPGSGKTTLAEVLMPDLHFEADMYWMINGEYKFDASKLHLAHKWCFDEVELEMMVCEIEKSDSIIVVSNTFTTEKELNPYLKLAKKYGFQVTSLVVENRHGGISVHGVPDETLEKMEKRFSIKLR